jgi:glycosyltransferase involved in cell wall biosynthesis
LDALALVIGLGAPWDNAMTGMKVLALTRYDRMGASSRVRFLQYLPLLRQAQTQITVQPLISDELLAARYLHQGYGIERLMVAYAKRCRAMMQRHSHDVLWIEKEALPWCPFWLERALLRKMPYVLDYDDAVFHAYDQHPNRWVRQIYGRRLDRLMASATLVIGGNSYLAQRARDAGAPWVEVLPTAIDLDHYPLQTPAARAPDGLPRIVWIGSPSTVSYLNILHEPLQALARQRRFVLRTIGAAAPEMSGVPMEHVAWTEDTETVGIGACDIGVMPLLDTAWERGKCGYKLIQYFACGLPAVASPVGVNPSIVHPGENGFLAATADEWLQSLLKLLDDKPLRTRMGLAGRQRVEQSYCIQQTGPRLVKFLQQASRQ